MTESGHCVHQNGVCCICGKSHTGPQKVSPALRANKERKKVSSPAEA